VNKTIFAKVKQALEIAMAQPLQMLNK